MYNYVYHNIDSSNFEERNLQPETVQHDFNVLFSSLQLTSQVPFIYR